MPLEWLALTPLPPFLAALLVGLGLLTGRIHGESGEYISSRIALYSAWLALALLLAAVGARLAGLLDQQLVLGTWLHSGTYHINIEFTLDGLSLSLACLFAVLSILVMRFSINYLHRERGFHRFFMVLALFLGAMLLLVTAGNAALAFVGWELAGVASYLLIAFYYDRRTAAVNANRAFISNRIGDAGFVLGIGLAWVWTGGIDWNSINGAAAHIQEWQAGVLAACFLLAAVAKSALVPLSPWLARAMEGPTPSSAIFYGAVMVHAGVYLVLRLQGLFEQAPLLMGVMVVLGLLTAVYGFFCGLAQTDVKSALIFATTGQIGLMFVSAGLGFWRLALAQLCVHAVFRAYQFLTAPGYMHAVIGLPPRPVNPWLGRNRGLYVAALQRLWLEPLLDRLAVKPAQALSSDLYAFDRQIIVPLFGVTATPARPSKPAPEKDQARRPITSADDEVFQAGGLAGRAVFALANAANWFEEKLVLQGLGPNLIAQGRRLGGSLNRIEDLLSRPRYLVILILASLLAVV